MEKQSLGKNVGFERLRRITGYLVGNLDRWNNAKLAEQRDRVKHNVFNTTKKDIENKSIELDFPLIPLLEEKKDDLTIFEFNKILEEYIEYWNNHDVKVSLQHFIGLTDKEMELWSINTDFIILDFLQYRKKFPTIYKYMNKEFFKLKELLPEDKLYVVEKKCALHKQQLPQSFAIQNKGEERKLPCGCYVSEDYSSNCLAACWMNGKLSTENFAIYVNIQK